LSSWYLRISPFSGSNSLQPFDPNNGAAHFRLQDNWRCAYLGERLRLRNAKAKKIEWQWWCVNDAIMASGRIRPPHPLHALSASSSVDEEKERWGGVLMWVKRERRVPVARIHTSELWEATPGLWGSQEDDQMMVALAWVPWAWATLLTTDLVALSMSFPSCHGSGSRFKPWIRPPKPGYSFSP
jgi:hypothetical protein